MRKFSCLMLFFSLPALAQAQSLDVWDTGKSSSQPLTPATLKKADGWTKLSRGGTETFKGDAVLSNGRLTAVFRKKSTGVELYGPSASCAVVRLMDPKGKSASAALCFSAPCASSRSLVVVAFGPAGPKSNS